MLVWLQDRKYSLAYQKGDKMNFKTTLLFICVCVLSVHHYLCSLLKLVMSVRQKSDSFKIGQQSFLDTPTGLGEGCFALTRNF